VTLILDADAVVRCEHDGTVQEVPSQAWVFVGGANVLVEPDPVGRDIPSCPNAAPPMKKCAKTLNVHQGYSGLVFIGGVPVVLADLKGITDGTPPGNWYRCRDAGQHFVEASK
jgi:hypothetical protein